MAHNHGEHGEACRPEHFVENDRAGRRNELFAVKKEMQHMVVPHQSDMAPFAGDHTGTSEVDARMVIVGKNMPIPLFDLNSGMSIGDHDLMAVGVFRLDKTGITAGADQVFCRYDIGGHGAFAVESQRIALFFHILGNAPFTASGMEKQFFVTELSIGDTYFLKWVQMEI